MKKLMLLTAALVFTLSLSAQDKTDKRDDKMMDPKMKDCVMMEGGKMTVMKEGKVMDLTNDMTLSNGTVVSADGKVKMKDGTTKMLKDGDRVFMDGKMLKPKMDRMKKEKM